MEDCSTNIKICNNHNFIKVIKNCINHIIRLNINYYSEFSLQIINIHYKNSYHNVCDNHNCVSLEHKKIIIYTEEPIFVENIYSLFNIYYSNIIYSLILGKNTINNKIVYLPNNVIHIISFDDNICHSSIMKNSNIQLIATTIVNGNSLFVYSKKNIDSIIISKL